jgi:single-stranded DNA-binding protein
MVDTTRYKVAQYNILETSGFLTTDPSLHQFEKGQVANANYVSEGIFYQLNFSGQSADFAMTYLKKGSSVAIVGKFSIKASFDEKTQKTYHNRNLKVISCDVYTPEGRTSLARLAQLEMPLDDVDVPNETEQDNIPF